MPATPPRTWECHLHLTNDPRAPRIARHTIRTALLDYGNSPELAAMAELLTSELVSNAVKHSDGPLSVWLHTGTGVIRIGEMDNDPELPNSLPCTTDAPFGRGLSLVQAMAARWGRYRLTDSKVVWFELN
ncbi:ATP-binding protein [Streptomyces antnestii]|uniref:ATP-binding protein n=1 Tax=Streptomyces antnestii TaxID=2494256 RepID=A0A3S2YUC3_9ACTN|nr:ATP-binding protein [Streptomyces sp. San01]RVU19602.1 ATP-binding protein [Streptomyces sp. San01]